MVESHPCENRFVTTNRPTLLGWHRCQPRALLQGVPGTPLLAAGGRVMSLTTNVLLYCRLRARPRARLTRCVAAACSGTLGVMGRR